MKCMYKVITVVSVCAAIGQCTKASAPTATKPIKIKMVKTDAASRGKPWQYNILNQQQKKTWTTDKTIKRDVTISVKQGDTIQICPTPETCKGFVIEQNVTTNNELAIDGAGDISVRPKSKINLKFWKKTPKPQAPTVPAVTGTKINASQPVSITVEIPKAKVKAPFTLKSVESQNSPNYYDFKTVTSGNIQEIARISSHPNEKDEYYSVSLAVEAGRAPFISINSEARTA